MKKVLQTVILATLCLIAHQDLRAQHTKILLQTTQGDIVVRLYKDVPLHRANFIKLAKARQLDSTLFHRVIKGFMIQGGDPDSKHSKPDTTYGEGDLPYKVPAELMPDKHFHKKGVIAAARDDNAEKASSACQFYIAQGKVYTNEKLDSLAIKRNLHITPTMRKAYTTVGGIPHLDGNYTVFGEVVHGLNIVDSIAAQPTDKSLGDRPVHDIRLLKARVLRQPLWWWRMWH
jgi:cyclophilin family peptidyl-prolyl cis-trans isomerase